MEMQTSRQVLHKKMEMGFSVRLHKFFVSAVDFWRRYKKTKTAVFGLVIILIFAFIAINASWLAPYDPYLITRERFAPPSAKHWLGTDDMGRDILSRIIYGSRVSLSIGFIIAALSMTIGIVIGAVSGYFGGKVDTLLQRLVEMVQMLPSLVLIIVVLLLLGGGIDRIVIIMGLLGWTGTARVVRAEFLSHREREYVEAGKALGFSKFHIIFSEILPAVIPTVLVIMAMNISGAILMEAGLSFLGLGDLSVITWGQMLQNAQRWISHAWWISLFPGLAIFLTVLSFNLIGDGINDAINPYLKER